MKKYQSKLIVLFLFFAIIIQAQTAEKDYNCFSILIGKNATADGAVMMAHNEDDWGNRIVNWYKVPRRSDEKEPIVLKRGHKIAQAETTYSYLWLEIPELEFSDSYFNEYGVVIASDACRSREDKPELVDGGIGYWLRRIMIERAKTARDAVKIAGKLIEEIGYASSGRTYCIADPTETWMLSVVQGKHWVARKVPDNQIAIIPNYYTITTVNLSDTVNYLGSADVVDYAVERGWYKPEEGAPFNFRMAYSDQENLKSIGNIARHWVAINALAAKHYDIDNEFPFSFFPKKKMELQDVFHVLRNHYEGTDLDETDMYEKGNPHGQKTMPVCSNTNQYGFVAQLRSKMPVEIGAVLWISPRRPCTESFIPIYSSMVLVPDNFAVTGYQTALERHFDVIEDFARYSKGHGYLVFGEKASRFDTKYKKAIPPMTRKIVTFEKELLQNQADFEKKMIELFKENPAEVKQQLTEYSLQQLEKIIEMAK